MKNEQIIYQRKLECMLENARKGQWLCPYPDDEDLSEVVVYCQHGLWYVMHDFQVFSTDEGYAHIVSSFLQKEITWDELLDRVIFPTFENNKRTFCHNYKGFSIIDPVYHFYVDGVEREVEYLEGPGVVLI